MPYVPMEPIMMKAETAIQILQPLLEKDLLPVSSTSAPVERVFRLQPEWLGNAPQPG